MLPMKVGRMMMLVCCFFIMQPCAGVSPADRGGASPDDVRLAELLKRQKRVCKRGLLRPASPAPSDDVL